MMPEKEKGPVNAHLGLCGPCFEFSSDGTHHEKRTVIIVPIVIEEGQEGMLRLSWGCNRAPNCMDVECRYSRGNRRRSPEENNATIEPFGAFGDR